MLQNLTLYICLLQRGKYVKSLCEPCYSYTEDCQNINLPLRDVVHVYGAVTCEQVLDCVAASAVCLTIEISCWLWYKHFSILATDCR